VAWRIVKHSGNFAFAVYFFFKEEINYVTTTMRIVGTRDQ
jgi:hypothetical protein